MKTVEVSESALESLKAMVVQLQSERDELLKSLTNLFVDTTNSKAKDLDSWSDAQFSARETIAKCTQTQSICDWQEKMK